LTDRPNRCHIAAKPAIPTGTFRSVGEEDEAEKDEEVDE
jgi:hypothetical protein